MVIILWVCSVFRDLLYILCLGILLSGTISQNQQSKKKPQIGRKKKSKTTTVFSADRLRDKSCQVAGVGQSCQNLGRISPRLASSGQNLLTAYNRKRQRTQHPLSQKLAWAHRLQWHAPTDPFPTMSASRDLWRITYPVPKTSQTSEAPCGFCSKHFTWRIAAIVIGFVFR